ncbi:MAG: extracellular solute-binding protein [Chloroflexales bacterium]|nr:extracellular solute-binding protein [Chloroflexales bacterium]
MTHSAMRLYALPIILMTILLSACVGQAPLSNSAAPASPEEAASPEAAPITVLMSNAPEENNPDEVARFQQLVADFAKLRPDVRIEALQGAWFKETFVARLAAGTMEDTFLVPVTEPQDLIAKGYVADITDQLKEWEHFDSFNPAVLDLVNDHNDRLYGIPVSGFSQGLIYNRKLFAEAGLDPDQPPATWEELRAYARQLTDRDEGRAGFVVLSKGNQGGWQFTAWAYSFGGDLLQRQGDAWVATFTDEPVVQALETIRAMRWEDQILTEQHLLEVKDVLPLLATERVAMAILAPDALRSLKSQYEANIEDFGFGPLPQAGGNATYTGGAVWMFNPKSDPQVLQAAVEWTLFRDFNLQTFEADLKAQQERGQLVGWPQLPLFVGEFQQQRDAIIAKYANAPVEHCQPYLQANLQLRTAPPVEAQQMFAMLDTALQAILTDVGAEPRAELEKAAQQFQRQVLDQVQ